MFCIPILVKYFTGLMNSENEVVRVLVLLVEVVILISEPQTICGVQGSVLVFQIGG